MKTSDKNQQPEDSANDQTASTTLADRPDWKLADPKSLKVNHEFQRLIPLQSKGELLALEESIKAEGCREPIVVWKGHRVVLDGHTRRELAINHKLQVKVREVELPDEKAAVEYILQIQRQRRNLTREAMSYFRGAEYNAVKQQHGGQKKGRKPSGQSDHSKKTGELIAEKYGVSEKTVRRDASFAQVIDKIVEGYGEPEIKRKLLGADVRLTHGLARQLLKLPDKQRKASVDELIEKGELPRGKKESRTGQRPKGIAQDLVARLQKKGEGHARSVLQQMAKLLGMEVVEKEDGK